MRKNKVFFHTAGRLSGWLGSKKT